MKTGLQLLKDFINEYDCTSLRDSKPFDDIMIYLNDYLLEEEKEIIKRVYNQGICDFAQYDPEKHGNSHPNPEEYFNRKFKN